MSADYWVDWDDGLPSIRHAKFYGDPYRSEFKTFTECKREIYDFIDEEISELRQHRRDIQKFRIADIPK